MRDYRFRAWHKKQKVMAYDVTPFQQDNNTVVMQYTGLKDINNKEIYECDITDYGIVKFGDYEYLAYEDHYSRDIYESAYGWYIEWKGKQYCFENPCKAKYSVLGNIYENPEQLPPEV
jgi:uncharacterized phage protein (TIGR01671 family)